MDFLNSLTMILLFVAFFVIAILVWSHKINKESVDRVDKALELFLQAAGDIKTDDAGESVMIMLIRYVHYAVHAAEQLFNAGEIEKDERRETAIGIVRDFAEADGFTLDDADLVSIDALIESECDAMGHKINFDIFGHNQDEACDEECDEAPVDAEPVEVPVTSDIPPEM